MHQMSLTPQLSLVANLNSKLMITAVEFDDLTAGMVTKGNINSAIFNTSIGWL